MASCAVRPPFCRRSDQQPTGAGGRVGTGGSPLDDAVGKAIEETGLDDFPEVCPWSMDLVLSAEFFPDA